MSHFPSTSTRACRRCGAEYYVPEDSRLLLAACPHCGASPAPLWQQLGASNGAAAVLALVALLLLIPAMNAPLVAMATLGRRNVYSLLGGILELFRRGQTLLGVVLFTFSVIFPIAKLLVILLATSALVPLSTKMRRRLHHIAMATGKYSLLDIVVVAVMIVLVKFRNVAEVELRGGAALFCITILLSMAAGALVRLRHADRRV